MKKSPSSLVLWLSVTLFAGQAALITAAESEQVSSETRDKTQLGASKRLLAQDLSRQYSKISAVLRNEITEYNLKINVEQLQNSQLMNSTLLQQSDLAIKSAKGLEYVAEPLLDLRLADKSMLINWQAGESPLFAFAPDGNDAHWDYIEAFDIHGNIELLDVYTMPERPVFVVGIDSKRALAEGIKVMRAAFSKNNDIKKSAAHAAWTNTSANLSPTVNDGSISTTLIKEIRLNDDQEPWILGKAEIYGIVNGVNPTRDEPVLDIIEMPYLDHDNTTYSPNQVVIHWERYRWTAADLILMEHDDGTNYKTLAAALLEAATAIMRLIPDPAVQGYRIIPQITNGIISAMPDAWFTNDDDYVDVYYTLLEGHTYNNHQGAGGNATATFEPLVIAPR
jgi:hypothetical protein